MKLIKRLKTAYKISKNFNFDEKGVLVIFEDDIKTGLVRQITTKRNILPNNIDKVFVDKPRMAQIIRRKDDVKSFLEEG